jgi:hypothetical protein
MNAKEIKKIAERTPFRPFTVRLSNGAVYKFKEPRDFGAPRNLSTIFYFSDTDFVLIDLENVAEVISENR